MERLAAVARFKGAASKSRVRRVLSRDLVFNLKRRFPSTHQSPKQPFWGYTMLAWL